MNDALRRHAAAEPRLARLVELCKTELGAAEVWLFGSRARGEAGPGSDWDLLAVLPDGAAAADDPLRAWAVKRLSGLPADLLTVTLADFRDAQGTVNTLSHAVAREGVRLDG